MCVQSLTFLFYLQGPSQSESQRSQWSGSGPGVPGERELPQRSGRVHSVSSGAELAERLFSLPGRRSHLHIHAQKQSVFLPAHSCLKTVSILHAYSCPKQSVFLPVHSCLKTVSILHAYSCPKTVSIFTCTFMPKNSQYFYLHIHV